MEGQGRTIGTATWDYQGKSFVFPRWTFRQQNEFAQWVLAQARLKLRLRRKEMGEAEYEAERRELRRDEDAFLYEWGGEIVAAAWKSYSGSKQLTLMTLAPLDKAVTPEWVDNLVENDRDAWDELWDLFLALNFRQGPVKKTEPEPGPETQTAPDAA